MVGSVSARRFGSLAGVRWAALPLPFILSWRGGWVWIDPGRWLTLTRLERGAALAALQTGRGCPGLACRAEGGPLALAVMHAALAAIPAATWAALLALK